MFEDTHAVIRSCKSKKDGHCNDQEGQTMIYKILYRKLKIEQHESHYKLWPNSDLLKGYTGADPEFQVRGGGALKKNAPSGGRREKCWGISCEKSRFYAKKKIIFFPILGGRAPPPPPGSAHGIYT